MVHALRGENFGVFEGGHRPYGPFSNYQESRCRPRLADFLSLPSSLGRLAFLPLEAGTKEKLMTPGPPLRFWHRTRRRPSFWLGLFVACFLAWAWWDSYRNGAIVWYARGTVAVAVIQAKGAFFFASGGPWFPPGFHWIYSPGLDPEELFAAWGSAVHVGHLRVPDSLVFFSFVGLWGGWLAFPEWLRKKRLGRVEKAAGDTGANWSR
jgi:hypothetical protein